MEEIIREAMARAFFASAWADQCEETGNSSQLSGCDIMDVMPAEIDPAALHAAQTLAFDMVRANGGASLATLYERAEAMAAGDREPTAENFGHYAAMQAMGHGVGLGDAFGSAAREAIQVPYVEFSSCSLERDYFQEGNPMKIYGVSYGDGNNGVSQLYPDFFVKTDQPFRLALGAMVDQFQPEWMARAAEACEVAGEAEFTVSATIYDPLEEEGDEPAGEGESWCDVNGAWKICEVFEVEPEDVREPYFESIEEALTEEALRLSAKEADQ